MSSVTLWEDREVGISCHWNKQAPHTVFELERIEDGIAHGKTTEYRGEKAALKAAKLRAKELREEKGLPPSEGHTPSYS
jgi:hypothetical protein